MKLKHVLVLLLAFAGAACTTEQTTLPGAIGVERTQRFMVSEQAVETAATQSYAQLVSAGRAGGAINADPPLLARVRQVANRLILHVGVFKPDAVNWAWEVNVMTTPEVNAWCMAGGKIMVYSGLVDRLQLTDAELAAVLGHEIGHALREHTREGVSNALGAQLILAGIAVATKASDDTMQLATLVSQVTFTLPNSREMETEADHIGLELMARAGYDPHAALSLFQKMAQVAGNGGPTFLSTHPQSKEREQDLALHLPAVLPLYAASRGGGSQ